MRKMIERFCEIRAHEIKADTGEWIYGRLVDAAAACKSNDWDDIADAIYKEADRYIGEYIEKNGEYGGYGFGGIGGNH